VTACMLQLWRPSRHRFASASTSQPCTFSAGTRQTREIRLLRDIARSIGALFDRHQSLAVLKHCAHSRVACRAEGSRHSATWQLLDSYNCAADRCFRSFLAYCANSVKYMCCLIAKSAVVAFVESGLALAPSLRYGTVRLWVLSFRMF